MRRRQSFNRPSLGQEIYFWLMVFNHSRDNVNCGWKIRWNCIVRYKNGAFVESSENFVWPERIERSGSSLILIINLLNSSIWKFDFDFALRGDKKNCSFFFLFRLAYLIFSSLRPPPPSSTRLLRLDTLNADFIGNNKNELLAKTRINIECRARLWNGF